MKKTIFPSFLLIVAIGSVGRAQDFRQPLGVAGSVPSYCALSPDGKTMYILRADDRVEALGLEKGKSIWKSEEKAKPLAAQKEFLGVLINEKGESVKLAALDAATGKLTKKSESYKLPLAESKLIIEPGSAGKQVYVGFIRKDNPKDASEKKALGTLYFDPELGKLEFKDVQMGTLLPGKGTLPKLEKPMIPSANWQFMPGFVSGERYIQVFYGRSTRAAYVISVQWDKMTGKFLEAKELYASQGGNAIGTIAPIASGKFVMHRPASGETAFYAAESGKKLLDVPNNTQLGWLAGPVLLGVEREKTRATLRAFDATTGKLAWSQPCHELVGR